MDEKQVIVILVIITIIMLGFISIGAALYAIPLCFIRRFHKSVHLLTLNVCIAAFICSTFWLIFFTMDIIYPRIFWTAQSCLVTFYLKNMVNCQVLYALCMVSLNRLFAVVYQNKALFRTKKWTVICVTAQWTFGTLIPLPVFASNLDYCLIVGPRLNYRIYALIIGTIIPGICLIITNSIIFIYTRRSAQRVQTANRDGTQAATLGRRDARLLKHMIFMFAVFFCGWEPAYIVLAIDGSDAAISPVTVQIFLIIPAMSLLITVADLFLYNHDLRRYLISKC